jgi:hypothetical protein
MIHDSPELYGRSILLPGCWITQRAGGARGVEERRSRCAFRAARRAPGERLSLDPSGESSPPYVLLSVMVSVDRERLRCERSCYRPATGKLTNSMSFIGGIWTGAGGRTPVVSHGIDHSTGLIADSAVENIGTSVTIPENIISSEHVIDWLPEENESGEAIAHYGVLNV